MPKVTNKKTGKTYTVDADGLKAIREHKQLGILYTYDETPEPDEVKDLKDQAASKGAASKGATESK